MKHATEIAQWSGDDIQDLFWRSAAAAFRISFGDDKSNLLASGQRSAISGV